MLSRFLTTVIRYKT